MIDAATASTLKASKETVLLCDPSGQVVARALPPSIDDTVRIPFTEAQLRETEDETTEIRLGEIIAELERQ